MMAVEVKSEVAVLAEPIPRQGSEYVVHDRGGEDLGAFDMVRRALGMQVREVAHV
jgi:hypothetical protein